jgi:hypothetical protein
VFPVRHELRRDLFPVRYKLRRDLFPVRHELRRDAFPVRYNKLRCDAFPVRYELSSYILHCPCGGGLEYLHRSPASRKRRREGNPVLSDETVMYGYESSVPLTCTTYYRPVLSLERVEYFHHIPCES